MGTILVFSLLVGLDNFQVAAGLGATKMCARRRFLLVCAFAVFESLMPFLGLLLGQSVASNLVTQLDFVPPACLALCGIAIIWQTLPWRKTAEVSQWTRNGFLLLPLVLSLDNLIAGAGLGALGYPVVATSLTIGVCSGGLCFTGLLVGSQVGQWIPRRANIAAGAWLLCVAGFAMFID